MPTLNFLEHDTIFYDVSANEIIPTILEDTRYYVTSVTAGTLQVSDTGKSEDFVDAGDLPDFTASAFRYVRSTEDCTIFMRAL